MVNCIDKLIFAIKIFDILSYNNFGNKILKNLRIENIEWYCEFFLYNWGHLLKIYFLQQLIWYTFSRLYNIYNFLC